MTVVRRIYRRRNFSHHQFTSICGTWAWFLLVQCLPCNGLPDAILHTFFLATNESRPGGPASKTAHVCAAEGGRTAECRRAAEEIEMSRNCTLATSRIIRGAELQQLFEQAGTSCRESDESITTGRSRDSPSSRWAAMKRALGSISELNAHHRGAQSDG